MIKKVIIPVAGLGTRFFPVTKSIPKEMIPVLNKPVIQYIVEEAVNSGIEEVIFVISKEKEQIKKYFSPDNELYYLLDKRGKIKELEELKKIDSMANFHFAYQDEPLGDGHAILCAEEFIEEGEAFAVLFGDDLIKNEVPALKQLIDIYNEKNASIIGVQEVEGENIEKYGVVGYSQEIINNAVAVSSLVEKPKYEDAPSNLGIIGKYVCKYEVLEAIKNGSKSHGELRLIDGFNYLLDKDNAIYTRILDGDRYDTGTIEGWIDANNAYAIKE